MDTVDTVEVNYHYEGDNKPTKTVTAREIIEAIRANGITQAHGEWFDTDGYTPETDTWEIKGGCALGQAARNLGIDISYIMETPLALRVIALNDDDEYSLKDIADILTSDYEKDDGSRLEARYEVHEADYSKGLPNYIYERLLVV